MQNKIFKIIFAGTPEFATPSLQALIDSKHELCAVYTQPDRPSGRGQKPTQSPIKNLALKHEFPIYQPRNFNEEAEIELLSSLNADLMIVVAYGIILPSRILTTPTLGCINVHASLLPHWRGAAPIQYAIRAGDKETGITIMQLDEGMDTGPILNHISCPIHADDTAQSLHDRLAPLGAEALLIALEDLEQGKTQPKPQDNRQASYAAKLNKSDAHIDWHQDADKIERMIRAYNPWPIAYSEMDGEIVRIWQAKLREETTDKPPGTIISASKQGIAVATGKGTLSLSHIQLPGAKVLQVGDILNARRELFAENKHFTVPPIYF